MITAQDLLDLMPIVADRGWLLAVTEVIRDADGRCPVCALANEIDPLIENKIFGHEAFGRLDIDEPDAISRIMTAADLPSNALRPQLMQALGMVKE